MSANTNTDAISLKFSENTLIFSNVMLFLRKVKENVFYIFYLFKEWMLFRPHLRAIAIKSCDTFCSTVWGSSVFIYHSCLMMFLQYNVGKEQSNPKQASQGHLKYFTILGARISKIYPADDRRKNGKSSFLLLHTCVLNNRLKNT